MAKFSTNDPFVYDDFDDPADLVMMTDERLEEAEEKSAESEDNDLTNNISAIDALKESGCVSYDCDDEDEEDVGYDEEKDDATDLVDIDAEDYREERDSVSDAEDLEEDEDIDTVIDGDDELIDDDDF